MVCLSSRPQSKISSEDGPKKDEDRTSLVSPSRQRFILGRKGDSEQVGAGDSKKINEEGTRSVLGSSHCPVRLLSPRRSFLSLVGCLLRRSVLPPVPDF